MFLSEENLQELTHKKRSNAQAAALAVMGIEHKLRPDGSVVVLRSYIESLLGGRSEPKRARKTSPDFSQVK